MSIIKKFPSDMMDSLRKMIVQEPQHFLLLPRTKQELLVDKMVQTLVSPLPPITPLSTYPPSSLSLPSPHFSPSPPFFFLTAVISLMSGC